MKAVEKLSSNNKSRSLLFAHGFPRREQPRNVEKTGGGKVEGGRNGGGGGVLEAEKEMRGIKSEGRASEQDGGELMRLTRWLFHVDAVCVWAWTCAESDPESRRNLSEIN